MNRSLTAIALALGVLAAGTASAQGRYYDDTDWARVVRVDPIVERYDQPVPRNVCYDQPVEYYRPNYVYEPGYRRDTTGPAILGALIGGALGNQVGKGDGRKAATIVGAVAGGSIAANNARRRGGYVDRGYVEQGVEQRCETRTEYRSEEQVVGYDVTYDYHGRIGHVRTDAHPGNRIRVAVDVRPL
ncbi:MAG TPA: glycine zipper 2TM domain-containing protein [Xanthomonadales bacterium]|nr:glycine zipper 2TM domain-containing protein [Xanthomonadales bacterium]